MRVCVFTTENLIDKWIIGKLGGEGGNVFERAFRQF